LKKEREKMVSVNDLTISDIARIKTRLRSGEPQYLIAAAYKLNQGRVNEIAKGKRFTEITPKMVSHRTMKPKKVDNIFKNAGYSM